jgi:arylsulfatase A-like enzyme
MEEAAKRKERRPSHLLGCSPSRIAGIMLVSLTVYLSVCPAAAANDAARPNFLVVLTDDLGFSDLGCYGSEIDTPTLDKLAAGGLRFSQFYNTAKCHSSRVSLLTGRYCIQAGDVKLTRATTTAEVLGQAGYFTAMTGKWHLDKQPTDFGFDRYFGHLSGACNYYKGDGTFRLNGEPWQVPADGFYTTVADVDYALEFLDEARETKKPWFLYVAFNAPHAPLQPLEADYRKYLGRYDVGWDVVRDARLKKQSKLGLFGEEVAPSPRPEHVPAWDGLSEQRRHWESRRMAAYAALIDRVDQELGRLVTDLRESGELENTFILFLSDNGACPYDRRHRGLNNEPYLPDTSWSDSTGWAWARNAPFRFYKQNQYEGGIGTPGIIHWPAGLKTAPGAICREPVHLIDVLPTLADLADAPLPEEWPGRELEPVSGISLAPILAGKTLGKRPPIHLLFSTDRGLRDGDWKLVSFRSHPWELYNLSEDRAEICDLAASRPEIRDRLVSLWHDMAENVLLVSAKSRVPVATEATPLVHREWTDFSKEPIETPPRSVRRKKPGTIRARKETQLAVEKQQLVLTCTGTDSGIAIDALGANTPAGPYELRFRLQSQASGEGEVYFTTDGETILPRGEHITFEVNHDGQWHEFSLKLDTDQQIHALRFDPCSGPGVVRIEALKLTDSKGKVIQQWPKGRP